MRFMARVMALMAVLAVTACSVNPVTGNKEFTVMNAQQEVAMGEQNYKPYVQQQGGKYVVDPELNLYVNQVGQKLAAVSDRKELPYEFVVLNSGVPNAWALPGGKVAINRGLLVLLEDEAQLAAVLGHEIVHAAARHTARQMTQATILQAGVMAAGVASQATDYGQWIAAGAGLGANLYQAHYGRDQELEADRHGIEYMVRAGYNPQAAVELQEKFVALSEGQASSMFDEWLASHPPSHERVARNQKMADESPGGVRNKQQFQQATAQLRKDKDAYAAYQKALEAAGKEDLASAKKFTAQAIKLQPKESLFHITEGQLALSEKDYAAAQKAFAQAVKYNPEYYVGPLGLGLSYKQQNNLPKAKEALGASMNIMPTPLAAYHMGEISLAENNSAEAKKYFQFAAQGQGQVAEAAKAQLAKLGE